MTRSFSYLCITITNTICLTGLWILIALFPDLFVGIESLTTILKSSIWLGFIMDSVVCFSEFALLVWLKVQVPPLYYFLLVICSSLKLLTGLLIYLTVTAISMTTLLTHTVAHSTKPSFRPKTNNQPLKKFLSLALSWAKVVKNWTSF